VKNILITGPPRSGKTTLVMQVLDDPLIGDLAGGFLTEECREKGERTGFRILPFPEGKPALLAHVRRASRHRLGRYGVDLNALENVGCPALARALVNRDILVVDEIGKMELFSAGFRDLLLRALASPKPLLATIMERPHPFADGIKEREDVEVFRLSKETFPAVFTEVKKRIIMELRNRKP